MKIRRLTITLPSRLKHTAQHDARRIGEAVAEAVWNNGGKAEAVNLPGHGQEGYALSQRVGAALPRGKRGSGHGS